MEVNENNKKIERIIKIETDKKMGVYDITEEVENALENLKRSGIVLVYTFHTTTGIVINEAESGLMEDILKALSEIIPKLNYKHNRIDNNAEAHIKAAIVGNNVIIPVKDGKLILGTWQRILFLEFDGPRTRKVYVKILEG